MEAVHKPRCRGKQKLARQERWEPRTAVAWRKPEGQEILMGHRGEGEVAGFSMESPAGKRVWVFILRANTSESFHRKVSTRFAAFTDHFPEAKSGPDQ